MCELHDPQEAEAAPRGITTFVDELVVTLTNARIYAPGHPRVAQSLGSLSSIVIELIESDDARQIVLGSSEGYLFHEGRPLLGASLSAGRLISALAHLSAGGFRIERGVTETDLLGLVDLLHKGERGPSTHLEANQFLSQAGCEKVTVLPEYGGGGSDVEVLAGALGHPTPPPPEADRVQAERDARELLTELRLPRESYQQLVSGMQEVTIQATRGLSVNLDATKGHVESVLKELTRDPKNMMGICRYERYDAFTFGHSIRVCSLALYFAKQLASDEQLIQRIGEAALLHDVGKARVPAEILFSRGRLSDEERSEMNRHTLYGADILLDANRSDPVSVATAFGHHTRYEDETRTAPRPSVVTRIVKICDVFEALTAVRPYKDRMPPARAYRIMFGMNGHFDPALLRRFVEVNGLYPVGAQVRLASGAVARVHAQTDDFERPVVDIESAPIRRPGDRIDLSTDTEQDGGHVVGLNDELGLDVA